jgi:tetratricopeptide (TPR) repeat protein
MIVLACCLACISLPGRVNAQFFDRSYAIVIGIDHYEFANTWPTLSYAVKDAQAMAGLLRGQGFTVIPLYETQANKQAILSSMQDNLAPRLGPRDRVLVFFAGHGKTEKLGGEKRGYIVPYDGNNSSSLISMEELKSQSSYMGSAKHQLFIMDSCYGGLLAAMRDSIVDPHVPNYLRVVTDRTARQVLTAGGEGQTVLDGGPKGHSVFMDALLEGLQDGLADLNGDGYITFHELVAYVTPRASNDYQTPGDGVLPGHQEGEFLFENPKGSGRPVAEIPLPADTKRRSGESAPTAEQYLAFGDARWSIGDWDGAIAQYLEALRLKPDYAEAHNILGAALSRKDDWKGAMTHWREALRLKPDYAEAHEYLGFGLSRTGDWDGAIAQYLEALRLKPDYAEAHSNLGVALGVKGHIDDGITEEREALRLNPDLAEAHEALGSWLGSKGDWDGEIREEREAIRLKPDLVEAHAILGFALRGKGDKADWDEAIRENREAIRLKPDFEVAHVNLGTSLGDKGDWDGEIREEREAIRLKPDDANAHVDMGIALQHKGDTQSALAEYRRALELKPGLADAQSRYDELLRETNSSPR